MSDKRKCIICGKEYEGPGALSRRDNKTEICPDCGMREALVDAGFKEDCIEAIIKSKPNK